MTIGERLKSMREAQELSQEALSERTRTADGPPISRVQISNLERGSNRPGVDTLLRLEAALGLEAGDLLRGVKDDQDAPKTAEAPATTTTGEAA